MTDNNNKKAAQAKEDGKRKDSGTNGCESVLKRSRDEARNVNPHRSKKREDNKVIPDSKAPLRNQADEKTAKRFTWVRSLLDTLPQFVDDEGADLAANMLSLKIELRHMENKVKQFEMKEDWYPDTCKIKFKLTCKTEFKKNQEFEQLVKDASQAVQECNNTLRECIYKKKKLQEAGAIRTIQEKAIKNIAMFCEIYTCAIRDTDKHYIPPYDDKTAGEMLTKKIMLDQDFCDERYQEYLGITNVSLFKHKITCLSRPKTFNESENTTEEMREQSDAFINKNVTKIERYIKPLTIGLYETYNANMVKEEAARRTAALRNENKKSSAAKGLDKLIGNEKSVEPEVLKTMIVRNVEEKLEKAVSKKTSELTKVLKSIELKQKEFEKKAK